MEKNDPISRRIQELNERYDYMREHDWYYYLMSADELRGSKVLIKGREMLMLASYRYLDLIGHPRIVKAAKAAIDAFSTGTH